MSPEQLKHSAGVDTRTDIWSLGVVLYQLASGELPFDGETFAELSEAIQKRPHVPLSDRVPDLPDAFVGVVDRCLAKDPAERPGSALELARGLAELADPEARRLVGEIAELLETRGRELEQTLDIVGDPTTLSHRVDAAAVDDTHAAVESRATAASPSGRSKRIALALGAALVIGALVAIPLGIGRSWTRGDDRSPAAGAETVEPPPTAERPAAPFKGTVSEQTASERAPIASVSAPSLSAAPAPSARLPRRPFPRAAATATQRSQSTSDPYLDRK
jgi:serine/threonine-protein kinase